jgi:hypothetical protein
VSGKVAGALKIVAPEAAVAAKVAGGGKPKPGSAADHRAKIDEIKARRPPEQHEDQGDDQGGGEGRGDTPAPAAARSGPLSGMEAPSTGGGFVLGLIVWAVARAWIGNPGEPSGAAGVKRLLKSKFLNKTS